MSFLGTLLKLSPLEAYYSSVNCMAETIQTTFGLCACGQSLLTAGAKRCPQCRAAHARAHVGRRAERLRELPRTASPRHETSWIACNLESRRVDLDTAPSLRAFNLLSAIKKDEKLKHAFWISHLKPRLKPRRKYPRGW